MSNRLLIIIYINFCVQRPIISGGGRLKPLRITFELDTFWVKNNIKLRILIPFILLVQIVIFSN